MNIQVIVVSNRIEAARQRLPGATDARRREIDRRIIAYARGFAPVRTGYLRDHIIETNDGVESMAFYSGDNEWGTRRMRAHPFMRPAAAQAASEMSGLFGGFGTELVEGVGGGFGDVAGLHIGRV